MRDYAGAIHVHTKDSDGSGSLDYVLRAAADVGLDFLIVTDHNVLKLKVKGREGWYGGLLLLAGEEISPRRNHYLAMGIDRTVRRRKRPSEYMQEVSLQGGLGFIVHPHAKWKLSLPIIRSRPWKFWPEDGFTGLELWSYMWDWIDVVHLLNLPYYYLYPEQAIKGPKREVLKIWDELTQKRPVVAIGGLDAHAKPMLPFGLLKVFPYKKLFRTIRTHIISDPFTKEFEQDRKRVYSAIQAGRCYIAYDLLADASGFSITINSGDNIAQMGEEVSFSSGMVVKVSAPTEALLRLVRNGKVIFERLCDSFELNIDEPGVYRVEACIGDKPWVFTNPIYIREVTGGY